MDAIELDQLKKIKDQSSLLAYLRGDLAWPAPPDAAPEEMFYDFSAGELRLDKQTADGLTVKQLAPFAAEQPWGVFLIETKGERLYTTQMRRILRGLAPTAKMQKSYLKAWNAENLLFIGTHDYTQFTFAHFRLDEDQKAAHARLSLFGWDQNDLVIGARTLREHNLPALHWPDDPQDTAGWLAQWSGAFDIEKVTDRFFKEFRDLFEDTKAALPKGIKKPAERHAFTQRLLNRLLFLCFLQKKRWMKGPDLAHPRTSYLFDLFDYAKAQGEEFYGEYLHKLFFSGLNRPPGEADERARMTLVKTIGIVPFLNGGLFDKADANDAEGAVSLSNKLFEPILGNDGLLRRYNFTVTESTPLNQEVAVDPEMLGKVFETVVLTSEEAVDYQAPNLRKATGSYYTPRIVVTFIVREALKSYLVERVPGLDKTRLTTLMELDAAGGLHADARMLLGETVTQKEAEAIRAALDNMRACDPAIGSGAFALGLLHELVNLNILCETVERNKDPRLAKTNLTFDLKKRIIERSIYGADLQGKAVEICKLRLWLSLVVDYEIDVDPATCTENQFERAIEKIPALPNLSYKIRRGDSLLDLVHGHVFRLDEAIQRSVGMQDARAALEKAHREFFGVQQPAKKRRLRLEALTQRTLLSRLQLEGQRNHLLKTTATQAEMGIDAGMQTESAAQKREREALLQTIDDALAEVAQVEKELNALKAKKSLTAADDDTLTRLEAGNESEAITFTWELDFPEVFSTVVDAATTLTGKMRGVVNAAGGQMEMATPAGEARGGFDVIVGNPPFVTARNEEKREQYRERWKEACRGKFQLIAPFFQRSFALLKPAAHLGFIVSNAFATREFGQPLVEDFFPTVELRKIVDCSGLKFPGHGTPTWIIFGQNRNPASEIEIRTAAIVLGGGDLNTTPEQSPLWRALEAHHDTPGYKDRRIIVADQPRSELAKWPWDLDAAAKQTRQLMYQVPSVLLRDKTIDDIGFMFVMGRNEVFMHSVDNVRRHGFRPHFLRPLVVGEEIRDWSLAGDEYALFPYDAQARLVNFKIGDPELDFLKKFKTELSDRPTFSGSFEEAGKTFYEYHQLPTERAKRKKRIIYSFISTHNHFTYSLQPPATSQSVFLVDLTEDNTDKEYHALTGLLNASSVLFLLKRDCYNKGMGDEGEADRFEYAGGKTEQIHVPDVVFDSTPLGDQLGNLSDACGERGQWLPSLALRKLFERRDEAYYWWNSALSGWVEPSQVADLDWQTTSELVSAHVSYLKERERLRAEMIALQEEMDWLVYEAYGLTSDPQLRLTDAGAWVNRIEPLALGERPFELLHDGEPIPAHFSAERRALWEARMKVIAENEHVRRIEQPVYKRRWYRKENDAQEFEKAFTWWVLEKAEWWLENKQHGGPVGLDAWATALWSDERVQAAVGARATLRGEAQPELTAFVRLLKEIVTEASVPDWIPPAMPWEQVEKKFKRAVPGRAKRIRGKLNVPRERFRVTEEGKFVWAGKEAR